MKAMFKLFYPALCLLVLYSCKGSSSSDPVLTHWLNGTFQANSHDGLLEEVWSHPKRDLWKAERQIITSEQARKLPPLEIKLINDNLSLVFPYQGNTYILPSRVVDMRNFEFQKEQKDNEPHRIKFEKTGDVDFRRTHYIQENGRNSIEPLEFKRVK